MVSEPTLFAPRRRAGVTLIELLTVVAIITILFLVAIPILIGNPDQRQLRSAADLFTADLRYARSLAQSESSRVFIVFDTSVDSTQIELPWVDQDLDGQNDLALGDTVYNLGTMVIPPLNPGVGRISQRYYIIQEKERTFPGDALLREIESRINAIRFSTGTSTPQKVAQVEAFLNTTYLAGGDPRISFVGKLPAIAMRPDLTVGELKEWLSTRVGTPFTYLDLFNDYRLFESLSPADQATVLPPTEPQYPRKAEDVFPASGPVDLATAQGDGLTDTNLESWPLLATPFVPVEFDPSTGQGTLRSYLDAFCPTSPVDHPMCILGDNSFYDPAFYANPANQTAKVFLTNSVESVLAMKRKDDGSPMADFTDNPFTDGRPNPTVVDYDPAVDNPELNDPVVDYQLVRERKLGRKVYLMNPFRNLYLIGYQSDWTDPTGWRLFSPQFLQYALVWFPDGTLHTMAWTWNPTPFPPDGTGIPKFYGQMFGDWVEVSSSLELLPRTIFMVTESAVEFAGVDALGDTPIKGPANYVARIDVGSEASQRQANAVRIAIWPLNGQQQVDHYTPNDGPNRIFQLPSPSNSAGPIVGVVDPFRAGNLDLSVTDINVVRSEGFNQNYLVP